MIIIYKTKQNYVEHIFRFLNHLEILYLCPPSSYLLNVTASNDALNIWGKTIKISIGLFQFTENFGTAGF